LRFPFKKPPNIFDSKNFRIESRIFKAEKGKCDKVDEELDIDKVLFQPRLTNSLFQHPLSNFMNFEEVLVKIPLEFKVLLAVLALENFSRSDMLLFVMDLCIADKVETLEA